MFDDIHSLPSIKNEILDYYLSYGWYRWGSYIFTVHTLTPDKDGPTYPVYWLRYLVSSVSLTGRQKKIVDSNKGFTVAVRPFCLTAELEQLHKEYVESVSFETATDLEWLLTDVTNEVYDTHVIEVRDGGKLIGAGIFDKGRDSIAGIINIYDPAYKKHSIGKYLMLLKYGYCLGNKIRYYYPGYFSTKYPAFDYKLFLDKRATEVFLPELNTWVSYTDFGNIVME